ncbi:SCP2 sterol-binding domain-containing protein [Micromonospora echinospora]|uniref:SCP2 sterol-binding domain-containing protein n=1 Tax=Micromonospora echinospora TaxID=1877 RepID=UPI00366D6973
MEAWREAGDTTGPAAEYLAHRVSGRHTELPETTSGTVRLDVRENGQTDHWYLTVDRQTVRVTRSAEEADLVVWADREAFDQLVTGGSHIIAVLLRNDVTARGRLSLLMVLRQILPGDPDARHPRDVARQEGRG